MGEVERGLGKIEFQVSSTALVNARTIQVELKIARVSIISYWGNLTDEKSLKMAPNGPKLHRTDKYTLNKR